MSIAMGLVSSGQPLEVQHFGYQLLQALVRPPLAACMHCSLYQQPVKPSSAIWHRLFCGTIGSLLRAR